MKKDKSNSTIFSIRLNNESLKAFLLFALSIALLKYGNSKTDDMQIYVKIS